MAEKGSSGTSTILVVIILIITFPFWIAIGGVAIGLVAGLFGAMLGLAGALFGGLVALITLPFKILFGWSDWSCSFPTHHNGFVWLALLIFAALIITKRKK